MTHAIDRARTLDELDPPAWGAPPSSSHLVTTCHRLRTKPIGELSSGDLRILIGQRIGLRWLIPLGIEVLESNSLAIGDLYSGDLLVSVLRTPIEFWSRAPEWHDRLIVLVDSMVVVPAEVSEDIAKFRARSI